MKKNKITGNLFTYFILILFSIILLYPIAYLFMGSFKNNAEIYVDPARFFPIKPTLENYRQLFGENTFNVPVLLRNSVVYSTISIITAMIMNTMGAYVFARGEFPGKKLIFTAFSMLMFVTAGAITIYCTFDILHFFGIKPSLYSKLFVGLFSVPVVGYYMVKGYIDTIPKEMDEAAKIDGCGFIATYFKIILPMLKPMLATMAVFALQGSWNDYINVLIWTSTRPQDWTFTVGVMAMRNSGNAAIGTGFTLAATVISIIPVLIMYACCNKMIVESISSGAVKG